MSIRSVMSVRSLFVMLAASLLATPALAQLEKRRHTIDLPGGGKGTYSYLHPDDFDPAKTYPLAIGGDHYWQGIDSTGDWILLQTSLEGGDGATEAYNALIDHLSSRYNIEGERVHLVCYSACGGPVFDVAAAVPDRVASVTTVTGHPKNASVLNAVKHMKIRLIVGENDTYWRRGAEKAYRDFKAAGTDVTLEIIPGAGHVIPELVGAPFMERMEKLREAGE